MCQQSAVSIKQLMDFDLIFKLLMDTISMYACDKQNAPNAMIFSIC